MITRKLILPGALIGFALVLLLSAAFLKAGANVNESPSKPQERKLSSASSGVMQGRLTPTDLNLIVNSTDDGADILLGDGICEDEGGNCTLRAAIGEANAFPGPDMISFNIP